MGGRPFKAVCVVAFLFVMGCSDAGRNQSRPEVSPSAQGEEHVVVNSIKKKDPVPSSQQQFKPFNVYSDKGSSDNHFIPSGFMPNGKCVAFNDAWQEKCYQGSSCIKISYNVECSREDQKWAGVYWLNPANNWGNRKGGFDLTGAAKFTFWARGERGGEQDEEIRIGGITGDYPDSDVAVIGPIILSNEWREYSIDLRGKDLSYISGGFSWSTNVDVNPQNCIFYLDNMRYE